MIYAPAALCFWSCLLFVHLWSETFFSHLLCVGAFFTKLSTVPECKKNNGVQTDAKPVSEIDTRQIFHLLPLCHLRSSCVEYIRTSPLPLLCSHLFFCLSFIHNRTFCLLMPPDTLLSLQLLLSNFPLHPPGPCILFHLLFPIPLFSPVCSVSVRPRVSAKGNAVRL